MKCPRCGLSVSVGAPRCRGCSFSIESLDRALGAPPPAIMPVDDGAGVLSEEGRATLERHLRALAASTGGEVCVVTRATTRPVKPAEYAFWLFNRWQLARTNHHGLLILLAVREQRIETEVGYGWEAIASDLETGAVLDAHVVPRLRDRDFERALLAAVDELGALFAAGRPSPRPGL